MKLLTEEIITKFKEVGSQEEVEDPVVVLKIFNPTGYGSWLCTEFDPDRQTFFGYVSLGEDCDEFGDFSLKELEEVRCRFGLRLERDLYCGYKKLSEHLKSN